MCESTGAPIQVVEPTFSDDDTKSRWEHDQQMWLSLNSEAEGNKYFTAITVKGAYVIGTIFLLTENIAHLRQRDPEESYLPVYLLSMTIVELLGRCVEGRETTHKSTLKDGLKWLFVEELVRVGINNNVVTTDLASYSIEVLEGMRNFCAHGQATSTAANVANIFQVQDLELVEILLVRLQKRIDEYWTNLTEGEDQVLSGNLARAKIEPVNFKRVSKTWVEFERRVKSSPNDKPGHRSAGTIFNHLLTGQRFE